MRPFLLLLSTTVVLCTFVTSDSHGEAARPSTILLHTTLHDSNCQGIVVNFAKQEAPGRWVKAEIINIKGLFDLRKVPSQVELPPGEYGVVNLYCVARRHAFSAGATIEGRNVHFKKPIATFRAGAGEVVDIGSLQIRPASSDRGGAVKQGFISFVTRYPTST